jgi:hypothetical protein
MAERLVGYRWEVKGRDLPQTNILMMDVFARAQKEGARANRERGFNVEVVGYDLSGVRILNMRDPETFKDVTGVDLCRAIANDWPEYREDGVAYARANGYEGIAYLGNIVVFSIESDIQKMDLEPLHEMLGKRCEFRIERMAKTKKSFVARTLDGKFTGLLPVGALPLPIRKDRNRLVGGKLTLTVIRMLESNMPVLGPIRGVTRWDACMAQS